MVRFTALPVRAGGMSMVELAGISHYHTATSASTLAAQLCGGALSGLVSLNWPATTRMTAPPLSLWLLCWCCYAFVLDVDVEEAFGGARCTRGVYSFQYIVKCGAHIFYFCGKFSQICVKFNGFGLSELISGNIYECWIPLPVVTHCVSPLPYRAEHFKLSAWSTSPCVTIEIVSNPRWGWDGKPGIVSPWYMLHPSRKLKSLPIRRCCSNSLAGAIFAFPLGYLSLWWAKNKNGSKVLYIAPYALNVSSTILLLLPDIIEWM